MRDIPLSLLRSLAVVHAEGGVRQAAKRLGVEHASVSRALRDLEAWLGVPLTHERARGTRLRLTPQGRELADAAMAAIDGLQQATARIREAQSARRVVIATPPSVANRWLLPRLDQLEAACPGVEVSVVVDTVRMGKLDPLADLSLRMGARPETDQPIHIIGSDIVFPVMSPEAWERAGRPARADALRSLPLLHDRDARTAWSAWRDVFGPDDLDVRSGARFTSADLVLRAAERGRGIALTRGWLAQEALADGLLMRFLEDRRLVLKDEWWIAEHEPHSSRTPVRRVRDWLIEEGRS